jgi:2-methylisocitrate lyase-like PEP mutase family enzyme
MVQAMKSLRELHREHKPLVSPLAHDALSARLIEGAGFKTFNIGGSAMLAARYALPDLGLAAFAEMLAGIRDMPCRRRRRIWRREKRRANHSRI